MHQAGEIGGLENDITILQSLSVATQKSNISKEFFQVENQLKALLQLTDSIKPATEYPKPFDFILSKDMSELFLEAINKSANVAKKSISVAKSVYFPQIKAGIINRKTGNSSGYMGFTVGVQIPLPLGNNRATVRKEKIAQRELNFKNEATKIELQNRVKSLEYQLITLKKEIEKISKTFNKANKFIEKLTIAYKLGEIGAYKYNQSFDAYFEVMQNYLALINTYNQMVVEYEFYVK